MLLALRTGRRICGRRVCRARWCALATRKTRWRCNRMTILAGPASIASCSCCLHAKQSQPFSSCGASRCPCRAMFLHFTRCCIACACRIRSVFPLRFAMLLRVRTQSVWKLRAVLGKLCCCRHTVVVSSALDVVAPCSCSAWPGRAFRTAWQHVLTVRVVSLRCLCRVRPVPLPCLGGVTRERCCRGFAMSERCPCLAFAMSLPCYCRARLRVLWIVTFLAVCGRRSHTAFHDAALAVCRAACFAPIPLPPLPSAAGAALSAMGPSRQISVDFSALCKLLVPVCVF